MLAPHEHEVAPGELLDQVDVLRIEASHLHSDEEKASLGQYLTGASTARLMASMLMAEGEEIHLLDPGAGVGTLLAAAVEELTLRDAPPRRIYATAYELDRYILPYLERTLKMCEAACSRVDVEFRGVAHQGDFIEWAVDQLKWEPGSMFASFAADAYPQYDAIILNPPYYKINADSRERKLLSRVGIETSNIYTGFLWSCARLLAPGGEMVSITPRSFANGTYHAGFRRALLADTTIHRLHVFDSRKQAFKDDAVLQENVIMHVVRKAQAVGDAQASQAIEEHPACHAPEAALEGSYRRSTVISSSAGPDDDLLLRWQVPYSEVIDPRDREATIQIVTGGASAGAAATVRALQARLSELGMQVSTGRVVDFRAREYLFAEPSLAAAPLIWPEHLRGGRVVWPRPGSRKPQAMSAVPEIADHLLPLSPGEYYVLTKRFSSKEERRRIVASLCDPAAVFSPCGSVGFENHLNYYHSGGRGLPLKQAAGLVVFLNSTLVDTYYRSVSGHTQVNSTDLRAMRYPTTAQLEALGERVPLESLADQAAVDAALEEVLKGMDDTLNGNGAGGAAAPEPANIHQRIEEAIAVLRDLGLPRGQQNERSALVLLSLLNLRPDQAWAEASGDSLMRVTDIIDRIDAYYAKPYAENSRETLRRQTLHQFRAAGLILHNPDEPTRPINSGKNAYQIAPPALALLRTYCTLEWQAALEVYLTGAMTLAARWAQERQMERIPLVVEGEELTLSPGGQNVLVKEIVEQFAPRWTPGGRLIYVGDTDTKWAHFDEATLEGLGVHVNPHGQFPDLIVYMEDRGWLVLIEAVTSHGPVSPKRREELAALFSQSTAGLVYVTAFLTREAMRAYLPEIAWETEVWVADAPGHLIHFNGPRFLGPYE